MNPSRLKVVEDARYYYVAYEESDDDWVAQFEKSWIEAKDWAHHMVSVYNERLLLAEWKPPKDVP